MIFYLDNFLEVVYLSIVFHLQGLLLLLKDNQYLLQLLRQVLRICYTELALVLFHIAIVQAGAIFDYNGPSRNTQTLSRAINQFVLLLKVLTEIKRRYNFKTLIICIRMTKVNLSKVELLSWLNGILSSYIPSINKIEQLGNGVAYSYLLHIYFPNHLKLQKIINKPKQQYESIQNLKLFANALQSIGINRNVEIAKLVKMRYQDNFQMLQFLRKHIIEHKLDPNNEHSNPPSKPSSRNNPEPKFKVKAPLQIKSPPSKKVELEDQMLLEVQTVNQIQNPIELTKIKSIFEEKQSDSNKLEKIKAILFPKTSTPFQDSHSNLAEKGSSNNSTPIFDRYRQYTIRPSLIRENKYLNNPKQIIIQSHNQTNHKESLIETSDSGNQLAIDQNIYQNRLQKQPDYDLLLTQQKGANLLGEPATAKKSEASQRSLLHSQASNR